MRFIRRLMRSRNRAVRFVGRVSRSGHRYYQRLEDRIDPLERMIKALNYPGILHVWHAPRTDVRKKFEGCLRRQIVKHTTWLVVDGLATVVAILLAPFLVPLPGPNVFFFFPFLRSLSHLQALRGARRALDDGTLSFRELPLLAGVEDGLSADEAEPVEGLAAFLRRVG